MTSEPGPWRNDRTPYLAGIMDAISEDGCEQVVFLKAVQVGFSEATRNLIGYWVDHDPGPAMLVMPNQQSAEEAMDERLRPLLRETPKLAEHVSAGRADNKLSAARLDTMTLYMAWAGSPQALASRPIRYIVFDEVDKYPPFAGKEADPISLGMKRLTTYRHRARAVIGSTPTTRIAPVWKAWEGCTDRRHYHVPCPSCGEMQPLTWQQVKYPPRKDGEDRGDHAERVEAEDLARYECKHCDAAWTTAEKNGAVRSGMWVGESPDAPKRRIGFKLTTLCSPWVGLSQLAGEWIRAQGDPAALMDFANSRLAEPFEEQASTTSPDKIREKAERQSAGTPMVVPGWASVLIATADVQKDRLYFLVRAWGHGYRSRLVHYGVVPTFEALVDVLFRRGYASDQGEVRMPDALGIDSRYRTDEVMALAQQDPARVWPLVGAANPKAMPIVANRVQGYPGVIRRTINPNYWQDMLQGFIDADDQDQWLPHSEVGDDYCRQMASMHKVHNPKLNTFIWERVGSGRDNHYRDDEVYQCMLAQEMQVGALPDPADTQRAQQDSVRAEPSGGGWLNRHKGRWT